MIPTPKSVATITLLVLVALAGFMMCIPSAIISDVRQGNGVTGPALIGGAACAAAQYAVYCFARKIWRESNEWILLGLRRRLWQILVTVAYGIGVAGAMVMLYES